MGLFHGGRRRRQNDGRLLPRSSLAAGRCVDEMFSIDRRCGAREEEGEKFGFGGFCCSEMRENGVLDRC